MLFLMLFLSFFVTSHAVVDQLPMGSVESHFISPDSATALAFFNGFLSTRCPPLCTNRHSAVCSLAGVSTLRAPISDTWVVGVPFR